MPTINPCVSAEQLTTHEGTTLSVTAEHSLYVNGNLEAAAEAIVGSYLSDGRGGTLTITSISVSAQPLLVINPVTASGTLLVSDDGDPVLAASHPHWIAPLILESATVRTLVNAALITVGDICGSARFAATLIAKLAATVALAALAYTVIDSAAVGSSGSRRIQASRAKLSSIEPR